MENLFGMDISKSYFDVPFNNKIQRFDNNSSDISKFLTKLPEHSICVMESTSTYGDKLAMSIINAGHTVCIVNPLQVKHFAKMKLSKVKTDIQDAKLITEFAKANFNDLRPYEPPSKSIQDVKQMETVLAQLIKQRTALSNQLEALNQYTSISVVAIKSLNDTIKFLNEQISTIEKQIKDSIDADNEETRKRITSIKGIGDKTACLLIAATNGFKNFINSKQLSSYFGCCPQVCSSGSSVRGSNSVSKIGLKGIRTALYMCSLSAIKYNNVCKELYSRLIAKGKKPKVARMAVVNKLIKQVWAIVSKNENFDNNYQNKFVFLHSSF